MKRKGPARDGGKERFWREAVGQQGRSGQSVRAYCRDHGLSEASFYAWRGELKRRRAMRSEKASERMGGNTTFVPVRLAASIAAPIGVASIEVALPSGVMLRLPTSMEPASVAALLIAWERGRC
jgi:transposase-like protein